MVSELYGGNGGVNLENRDFLLWKGLSAFLMKVIFAGKAFKHSSMRGLSQPIIP